MRGLEGNALHKRRASSLAAIRDTQTLDSTWSSFWWAWWVSEWVGVATLAGSRIQTAQPVCYMYQSFKKKKKKSCCCKGTTYIWCNRNESFGRLSLVTFFFFFFLDEETFILDPPATKLPPIGCFITWNLLLDSSVGVPFSSIQPVVPWSQRELLAANKQKKTLVNMQCVHTLVFFMI